jgi:hypothetical protein
LPTLFKHRPLRPTRQLQLEIFVLFIAFENKCTTHENFTQSKSIPTIKNTFLWPKKEKKKNPWEVPKIEVAF